MSDWCIFDIFTSICDRNLKKDLLSLSFKSKIVSYVNHQMSS